MGATQDSRLRTRDSGLAPEDFRITAGPRKLTGMRVLAVIPARLASTRLERKILREIAGRPMLAWVYEAACAAPGLADVVVATDSEEIASLCREQRWSVRMTSARHRSGTERVHEVASQVPADVYCNIQGDEPLTRPEHIAALLGVMRDAEVQVGTL